MRPTPKPTLLQHLITDFLLRGGEIEELPFGNSVRPDDGEDWHKINENSYKLKLDKQGK